MSLNGHIDRITARGIVQGWAQRSESAKPVVVAVLHEGRIVAQALADSFRRDLVAAGLGHGHWSFGARLRQSLQAGPSVFELIDAETLERATPVPFTLQVPNLALRPRFTVEELLLPGAHWTDEDVLSSLDTLHLDANYRLMGPRRFIDAAFHFALGRGAEPSSITGYAPGLVSGSLTPDDLLCDLLNSEERRGRGGSLPSPHDSRFPFKEDWRKASSSEATD